MEVHPPDHPILSLRDFFVHLFTITVGLLIALGLEHLVEVAHHRHLLHTAEASLHEEIEINHKALAKDEEHLAAAQQSLIQNVKLLDAIKAHHTSTPPDFHWYWYGMQNAAWDTARDTGAIGLMPYVHAQGYAIIYRQQAVVDEQATAYIHDVYRSGIPLQGGHTVADLQPAEIDAMIATTQQTIIDIKLLLDLCRGLDQLYANAEHDL